MNLSPCYIPSSYPLLWSMGLHSVSIWNVNHSLWRRKHQKDKKESRQKKRQKRQGKNVRENNCRLLLLLYALILEKVGESLWVSLSSAIRVTCNLFCWNGEQKWRKKQQSKIVVCYINSLATLQSFVKILKLREKNSLLLISYMNFKVRKCWCV